MQQFFCQIETNMRGIENRQVFIVGQMPRGERPPLFDNPYRGVPQFDLSDLTALQNVDGPQPYTTGRIYAPPNEHAVMPELPMHKSPYGTGVYDDPKPFPLAIDGAPVEGLEDDYRVPPARSVRARPDPSR